MMKKIILLLLFIFIDMHPCQKTIDCTGKTIVVHPNVHQMLQDQCETYREHLLDSAVQKTPRTIDLSDGQSFLKHSTLECLISCLHSPRAIQSIRKPQKLLALIAAAEYLQAPKDFTRKLWLHCQGKFNQPNLKPYEPEFIALGNQLFSLGEYIDHHYETKTHLEYSRQPGQNTLLVHLDLGPFKMKSLHGLSRISAVVELSRLNELVLRGGNITDYNLKQLVTLMPRLYNLDLSDNKIRTLKRTQIEGMPSNFRLILSGNPIESLEDDCLTHDILRNASGATIALYETQLKSEHFEKLKQRWSLHTDEAHVAVFFTHLLAASFGLPCMALVPLFARDMDHVQKCRPLDWIDGSVINSAALLTTLYIMYGFTLDKHNTNYEPHSITFRTSAGDYQYYNDSFTRNFWEFFKYSIGLSPKKNNR